MSEQAIEAPLLPLPPSPEPPLSPPSPPRRSTLAEDDDDVRNTAVSLNLTGADFDTVHSQLAARAQARIKVAEADAEMQLAAAAARSDHLKSTIDVLLAEDAQAQEIREAILDCERKRERCMHERDEARRHVQLARFVAERAILDEELARINEQEHEDLKRLAAERQAAYEAAKNHWEQTKAERDKEIAALDGLRTQLAEELERRLDRVRSLNDPLVSRTVATFLVWVGYGAAAATGLCIGELLARGAATPSATIAAAFVAWMSQARPYMHPLLLIPAAALGILLALASIAVVAWASDALVARIDKSWKKKTSDRQHRINIPSLHITRDSYAQLIAAMPFAYALGLFFAFISINPSPPGSGPLPPSSPVAIDQVVGTALGFLAAGMFVLYVTRILEPRLRRTDTNEQRWHHAWEIALLPLILISSLIVATIADPKTGAHWGALAVFMASALMTLAYGMVLRGVFRDVDYAEMRLRQCMDEIDDLNADVDPEEPGTIEVLQRTFVMRNAQRARAELTGVDRLQRIRRTYAPDPSQDSFWLTTWLAARMRIKRPALPSQASDSASPTLADTRIPQETTARLQAAEDALLDAQIELRTRQAQRDHLGSDADRRARIERLRDELAELTGRVTAADAEKARQRGNAEIAAADEDERFVRAWHLADIIKPPFDRIRGGNDAPSGNGDH